MLILMKAVKRMLFTQLAMTLILELQMAIAGVFGYFKVKAV